MRVLFTKLKSWYGEMTNDHNSQGYQHSSVGRPESNGWWLQSILWRGSPWEEGNFNSRVIAGQSDSSKMLLGEQILWPHSALPDPTGSQSIGSPWSVPCPEQCGEGCRVNLEGHTVLTEATNAAGRCSCWPGSLPADPGSPWLWLQNKICLCLPNSLALNTILEMFWSPTWSIKDA